ncbi:hypothetical protein [Listeria booriae]|uniref:hypothetical protein n=1 Tax=Listeria booriae TaxID=1552123 RepID=UPI0016237FE9|nr:hypothetical protein [Listeria booriae]MBC1982792.1 hypothetical protein [Listeria booriae]
MNVIKKGGVVRAKGMMFLGEKNGRLVPLSKGARLKVIKIYNSKTVKVQSIQGKITGNVQISEVEVIK